MSGYLLVAVWLAYIPLGWAIWRSHKHDPLPNVSAVDTWRCRLGVRLANLALSIAPVEYRAFVKNAIRLGLTNATATNPTRPHAATTTEEQR